MATAQDVISRARQLINDVASNFVAGLRWSDAELLQWLTDGQREIVRLKPEANPVTDIFDVVAHPRQRLSPATAYRLIRVESNGTGGSVGMATLAINFDEFGDVVELAHPIGLVQYTLSGWFRYQPRNDLHYGVVVEALGEPVVGSVCTHRIILAREDNVLSLRFDDPCGVSHEVAFPESPPPDQWVFFAVTLDDEEVGNQLRGYWATLGDTAFSPTRSVAMNAQAISMGGFNVGPSLTVGSDTNANVLDGDLAQVRQWIRVLTASELIAEKNSRTLLSTNEVFASNPLQGPDDLSDESGNNQSPEPNGSLTATDGPVGQT